MCKNRLDLNFKKERKTNSEITSEYIYEVNI